MERKVTIRDVAEHAGVSVASVSYAINNINKVTPETKEKIQASIAALNYSPNLTAKCLSKGSSNLIGILLPITEEGDIPAMLMENNPFFGEFIAGIEHVACSKGYDILISGASKNYKDWVLRRSMDGLIMLGLYPREIYEEIKDLNIPVVVTDVYEEYADNFHRVMIEDEKGAYNATSHLISLGHKKIAIVTGSVQRSYVNQNRYRGHIRALTEAGIDTNKNLIFEDSTTFDGGERAGTRLLDSCCGATAVFVTADIMALGVNKKLHERGVKIPEDMSIVGFDDIKFSQYVVPGLTTIKQDSVLKGRISASMIFEDIENNKRSSRSVTLETKLVVRGTTAKPGRGAML